MYSVSTQPTLYHQQGASSGSHFRSHDVHLVLRQQPKEALITTEGKEKARKPVDPPPIVQLQVKSHADPAQHFLQSPYLFMCTSLYRADRDEEWGGLANKSLSGSLVSSLHRLKDVDNKDGGFFVFGDISIKIQGTFRLNFSLFDLHKDSNEVQYLGSIASEPFKVLLPKDFKGMDESTYLSRAFSDQGVRLRLRKEPRAMMGNKRPYPYGSETPSSSNASLRPNMSDYSYGDSATTPNKRFRPDDEERKGNFVDNSTVSGTILPSTYASSHYPVRQTSLSSGYGLAPYPALGSSTPNPYALRTSVGPASTFYSNTLHPPTSASTLSADMDSHNRFQHMQQSYPQLYPPFAQQRTDLTIGDEGVDWLDAGKV